MAMICACLVFFTFFTDQILKQWVQKRIKGRTDLPYRMGPFFIVYQENRGAAFGFLKNRKCILMFATVIMLLVVIFLMCDSLNISNNAGISQSLSLITGGALGNLSDRIRQGFVIDFFGIKGKRTPVLNLADVWILTGSILYLTVSFVCGGA